MGVQHMNSAKVWARMTEKQRMLVMLYITGLSGLTARESLHSLKKQPSVLMKALYISTCNNYNNIQYTC